MRKRKIIKKLMKQGKWRHKESEENRGNEGNIEGIKGKGGEQRCWGENYNIK